MQSTYKKNQGLSLIEMMVSMVLGLFLVLGLTTMYLGSKKTDKVRDAISDIEENARLTLNTLRAAIQHAGYTSVKNISLDKPFQTTTDGVIVNENCRDGDPMITNSDLTTAPLSADFLGYTNDGNVDNNESDRVTVIYRADNPDRGSIYFDCGGMQQSYFDNDDDIRKNRQIACSTDTDNGGFVSTRKSKIFNGLYVKKSDKQLRCVGSRGTQSLANEPVGIVLAENIENMQIRYGVATGNGNDRTTRYENATQIENNNQWERVTSVQVAILVGSERNVLDKAVSHEFDLLDETVSLDADRKLYRMFSTTIHLPNRSRRELQTITRTTAEAP